MPIKVIGAGLGRTGTLSLKAALEELGFAKCYHMVEAIAHPGHALVWDAAARGEAVDWDALFEGYQATVDWPACSFYKELMERYPEAKVILTVRDPDRWYDSARQTIYSVRQAFPAWVMPFIPRLRRILRMVRRLIWDGMFQGRFEDRDFAIEVYRRHNDEVRRVVPPERLLVYEVKEGWGPLCAFLGVSVPGGRPFPHLNDAAEFRSRVRRSARAFWAVSIGVAGLVVLGVAWLVSRFLL
jgi:hypothetical protein